MIAGEIDISIGAMIPAGSMATAILSGYYGLPIEVGMLGALALGVLVGLVNGYLAVRTSVPSLIITLGTLVAMQGVVLSCLDALDRQRQRAAHPAGLGEVHVRPAHRRQLPGDHLLVARPDRDLCIRRPPHALRQLDLRHGRATR